MANVVYSPESQRDLELIGDYISEQLKSPQAALNTVTLIQDKIDKLEDFPQLGTPLTITGYDNNDYRFLVCLNYLAFYRIDGNNVYIDRILYGKRDYVSILFGKLLNDDF